MSEGEGTRRFTTAGIIGTVLLLVVVAGCVRLGVWQLDRLDQRRALNRQIVQRQQQAPLHSLALLSDTAASLYRTAAFAGRYDADRSIVLPGRSLRGVPGVHLLTPFLVAPDTAVLVNRGWVPAPDAATIPFDSFPAVESSARGVVLPFPGAAESLAPRPAAADTFRRVWYAVDGAALRAQFPYALAPAVVQLLPQAGDARYPRRLPPPALDEGPHLSYAIQWFAFALIGIIGWIALFRRSRRTATLVLALLVPALAPGSAAAQLRPYEPLDWRIFDRGTNLLLGTGVNVLWDQTVPLAGARGTFLEVPTYSFLWRSGRAGLEISGSAIWQLTEDSVVHEPAPGVGPAGSDGLRRDAGPVHVATLVRLSPDRWSTDVVLRFGTRIPTTSDESGLDRDRTDFFALAGGRLHFGAWSVAGESGLGINGARSEHYPQADVWVYSLRLQHEGSAHALFAGVAGHQDGHSGVPPLGNEDQGELRAGLRLGKRWWVQTTYVRGYRGPAARHGLLVGAGAAIGCRTDCLPFN